MITDAQMQYIKPPDNIFPVQFSITKVDAEDTLDPFVSRVHIYGITDKGALFLLEFKIRNTELVYLCKQSVIDLVNEQFSIMKEEGAFDVAAPVS